MRVTYTVIRSRRRTAAIQIADGKVVVRVPAKMTGEETDRFVQSHADIWKKSGAGSRKNKKRP